MTEELAVRLQRALRRRRRVKTGKQTPRKGRYRFGLSSALIGMLAALAVIAILELRLRPVIRATAAYHINHQLTARINRYLEQMAADYDALVTIHRDIDGNVTFKIGSGQIVFPNSSNKYIEIVNEYGNVQSKHLIKE